MADRIICAPPSILALLRTYVDVDAGEGGDIKRPLTADAYNASGLILGKVLTKAAPSGQDTFRVPDTHVGLITDIRAHIQPLVLSSDTAWGALQTDPRAVHFMRAQNCTISINVQERSSEMILGTQGTNSASVALSDIDNAFGGPVFEMSKLGVYAIVPPGNTLKVSVALKDSSAATVESTNGAEYGALINMVFLRRKRG